MIDGNILIFEGEDISESRKKLNDEKAKHANAEIIQLDANRCTLTDVLTANEAVSIFASERVICLENLFSGQKTREKETIAQYINTQKSGNHFLIYENRAVDKKNILKFLSRAKTVSCNYPAMLFRFLDSIGGTGASSLLSQFHSVLLEKEAEFIYVMLVRQFRFLIIASDSGSRGLTELQSWQASKFVRQAGYFSPSKLISLYRQLVSIDIKIKFGKTPLTMTQLLDIFLISL